MRDELVRLLKGLDFYRAWRISCIKRDQEAVSEEDINQIVVVPGSFFLQLFDDTKDSQCAQITEEVQRWYSHTWSDLSYMARSAEGGLEADVRQFLTDFRNEVGFDFHTKTGLLKKTANKVLKRREIANELEYYSLKELEHDLTQSVLSAEELTKLADLLRKFENDPMTS
ncbi:hypothetical protein COL8621_00188 [Actibacterium lipolyticum]|uniref:Uncharacterized protein n=1 Tax=Actibacterium lipolyticum TaxID=1524263 RepID=A0A238JKI8_9RHOB|nr:hypothetical protein COL8621_00188 [Actibacterium lipolyticum]